MAWALFLVVVVPLLSLFRALSPVSPDDALAVALALPALCLAAGVGWAARLRFGGDSIDGTAPASGSGLDLTLRYVRNTTEQTVLFALASGALYLSAPLVAAWVLTPLAFWFAAMRIAFWVGYRRAPHLRALGFAGTFHPTVGLLLLSLAMIAAG
ncbi:MAPEG family protein [Jannaschia aquimarina]|uniref:MAPEG family protein n=2 Tax=Jannaschia aquimarina TaxID=935700 RepID=A0A0D1CTG5_9RHOB|nr:MAPEG family protein [Jannaschia aquimarina]KIT18062.1 MAPEG family protein [Jannaschia aquimarina]SNS89563.1 MAPEG family protein [Jannaschia aquimarina]